jgi:hypothetical protein
MTGRIKFFDNFDLNASAYYRHNQYKEAVPASVIHREFDTPGFTWQLNFRTGQEKMKNYLSPGFDYTYLAIDEFKHLNLGGAKESSEFQAKSKTCTRMRSAYSYWTGLSLGHTGNYLASFVMIILATGLRIN